MCISLSLYLHDKSPVSHTGNTRILKVPCAKHESGTLPKTFIKDASEQHLFFCFTQTGIDLIVYHMLRVAVMSLLHPIKSG
jgi:hypothetical protein